MWFGADAPQGSDTLVLAVWGFAGVLVTQIAILLAPVIKARFEKAPATTSAPQPAPADGSTLTLAKDIGQLDQRADDADRAIELVDRARTKDREDLDDVLDYLDDRDPGWRSR